MRVKILHAGAIASRNEGALLAGNVMAAAAGDAGYGTGNAGSPTTT